MTIFSLLESFFFLFLGISFILVLLMVYHFKKKLDTIEKKNETLQDICKTICEELDFVKSQSQPTKLQTIDPFYLNYHKVQENHYNNHIDSNSKDDKDQEYLPDHVSDLFKTILVSGGGNSIPDALDIQNYENEDLDDVQTYDEDFEYQETDATNSTVEEVDDFLEEEMGSFEEIRVHVQKMEFPSNQTFFESDSKVEELDEIPEELSHADIPEEENREKFHQDEDLHDIEVIKTPPNKTLDESLDLEDVESKSTSTKAALQKLTLQMLRTMVIKDGLCTDPSKLKKLELIQIVLDSQ